MRLDNLSPASLAPYMPIRHGTAKILGVLLTCIVSGATGFKLDTSLVAGSGLFIAFFAMLLYGWVGLFWRSFADVGQPDQVAQGLPAPQLRRLQSLVLPRRETRLPTRCSVVVEAGDGSLKWTWSR